MARSSSCLICECIRPRWIIFGGACQRCIVDDDMWNVSECTAAQWGCENDLWKNKEWMSVSTADISILRLHSDFKYQVSSNARTSNELPMEKEKNWKLETCLPRARFCYRSARTIRTTTWFTAAALEMNYRHRWFIAAPRVWVQRARYRTFAKSLSKTQKHKKKVCFPLVNTSYRLRNHLKLAQLSSGSGSKEHGNFFRNSSSKTFSIFHSRVVAVDGEGELRSFRNFNRCSRVRRASASSHYRAESQKFPIFLSSLSSLWATLLPSPGRTIIAPSHNNYIKV